MITRICDRCGRPLEYGELRYVTKIQMVAAYDPLQISLEDLQRDHRREMNAILAACEGLTEEELMRDVYVEFQFDLCRRCQQGFVRDPLNNTG